MITGQVKASLLHNVYFKDIQNLILFSEAFTSLPQSKSFQILYSNYPKDTNIVI